MAGGDLRRPTGWRKLILRAAALGGMLVVGFMASQLLVDTGLSQVPTTLPTSLPVPPPTLPLPTTTAPTVPLPTVTVPTVTAPTVTAPTVTAPTVTAPTVTAPTVTAPRTTPTVTAPVTAPTVTAPRTVPTVTAPTVTAPRTTPTVTAPTVTAPRTAPTVTAPPGRPTRTTPAEADDPPSEDPPTPSDTGDPAAGTSPAAPADSNAPEAPLAPAATAPASTIHGADSQRPDREHRDSFAPLLHRSGLAGVQFAAVPGRAKKSKRLSIALKVRSGRRLKLVLRGPAPNCGVAATITVRAKKGLNLIRLDHRLSIRHLRAGNYSVAPASMDGVEASRRFVVASGRRGITLLTRAPIARRAWRCSSALGTAGAAAPVGNAGQAGQARQGSSPARKASPGATIVPLVASACVLQTAPRLRCARDAAFQSAGSPGPANRLTLDAPRKSWAFEQSSDRFAFGVLAALALLTLVALAGRGFARAFPRARRWPRSS